MYGLIVDAVFSNRKRGGERGRDRKKRGEEEVRRQVVI